MQEPNARSFLYVPAHRGRMLDKAFSGTSGAHAVIVDLEDGVPADERGEAERNLRTRSEPVPTAPPVLCRIRSGAAERAQDLELVPAWFQGVVLAKAEDGDDLLQVAAALARRGRDLDVWLLVETAKGVERLPGLLAMGVRVAGVMLGAGDLRADVGLPTTADERELDFPRARLVFAAIAAGVRSVVDTPDAEIEPTDRFAASVRRARDLGFTGKAAIHPAQLAVIHDLFRPTEEDLEWARTVLSAETGAQRVAGQMTDEATKRWARRILGSNDTEG